MEDWKEIPEGRVFDKPVLLYYPAAAPKNRGGIGLDAMMMVGQNTIPRKATHFIDLPEAPPPHA